MNKQFNILAFIFIGIFFGSKVYAQQNRYWVGKAIYQDNFATSADLSHWRLTEDNGTGSWTATTKSSAILKMDNTAGGNANRLFSVTTGTTPRLLSLDKVYGKVQYQVVALTGGTQTFYIQVQEYNASGTFISEQDLQDPQSGAGFYTINMSDYSWDPATTQVRFIIAAENQSGQQGTIELSYFSYYNTNILWSNRENWSATSGGIGGASLPGTNDNIYFDQNSISNAFIDVPVSVKNITLQSTFNAGLVQGGNNNFTVSGNSYLGGGFLVGETADLYVNNVTMDGTQYTATAGTIHISGSLVYISGNFNPTTGTIEFISSTPQSIPAVNYYGLKLSGTGTKTAAGSFSVAGNFTNNSTFNAGSYTVVFNGKGAVQSVSGTSITKFNNILIQAPAIVTLASAQQQSGVLTIQPGAALNANGNLTLLATSPTVTASIANLTGATLNGNITVQKYIYSSKRIYRYLSSPVNNAKVSGWQASIPITGTFSNPSTGVGLNSTTPSLFTYNEASAGLRDVGYTAFPASGLSSAATLIRGKGYSIFVRDNVDRPQVVSLTGTPYKGNIALPVTYTSTFGGAAEDGWNLVGNPYPASIDWSLIDASDRVGVDNAIYYLDNNNASPVYRTYVNGIGVNCSNGVISSSQGFWVKANASSPSLTLHETHKTTTAPSIYRIGTDKQLLRLQLDSVNATNFLDETVIVFQDDATSDFDGELDAYKLYNSYYPALGSYQQNASILSINTLNTNIAAVDTIFLFTHNVKAGQYRLAVSEYSINNDYQTYLFDSYLQKKFPISSTFAYTYTVGVNELTAANRFKLVVETALTTPILSGTNTQEALLIYPNPAGADKNVSLKYTGANNNPVDISVYDMMGNKILSIERVESAQSVYTLQLPASIEGGMYNVVVQYNGTTVSQKIIVK
ncbi:T9SS type A sorting domain-containing protein [Cytophaga aurantiaca]|uniref:T9SS type A sorting domain-containing protein n=1 Tax=Cytophaga aurantiaca TaxID=29530 RepID=UPI00035D3E00|nr:T9SS type A sorting domain-containing protein [Cytophaga aurantiaca]